MNITLMRLLLPVLFWLFSFNGISSSAEPRDEEAAGQVRQAEKGFAAAMADRDYARFSSFIAEEAIFFGQSGALRGKAAVIQGWKRFFDGAKAPFSWEPAVVEVLDSGKLALTSGPVRDAAGKETGTFNSIWRREADGSWKVVFDKGCAVCNCSDSAR